MSATWSRARPNNSRNLQAFPPISLHRRWLPLLYLSVLLALNLLIAAKLFGVEYSAYNGSVEGAFIANARVMVEHPGESGWWPLWAAGMPVENTYPPLLQWIVAAFSAVSGLSPARSFHIVSAAFYALGAPALFCMAFVLSRKAGASFVAALAYSCVSFSSLLIGDVALDAGGPLVLRRLQVLIYYGEAPHTVALTLLPAAVVCFHRALPAGAVAWKILAGVMAAFIALTNAFGLVVLGIALFCWMLAFSSTPWWTTPRAVITIGLLSYCWIAPWMPLRLIRAIRMNSPNSGGDYRYTAGSWIALAIFLGGCLLLWFVLRRTATARHLRFFTLFAYVTAAIVVTGRVRGVAVIPQPNRYHLEMDMALPMALVFLGAWILERLPARARFIVTAAVIAVLGFQTVHTVRYARELIRAVDPGQLVEYRIAKWMDANRPGERAFISGSSSALYNVFTDNPQFHGAHEPFVPNFFVRVAAYTIYSGMNAGPRDAEYSILWLKAFGARAITVSGPGGRDWFKPFANPGKFEGVLPVLWRDGGDTIYEVPARSASLAHVMPAAAVVSRTPMHGLDIEPVKSYVAALDNPAYPGATFDWKGMSAAEIHATLGPGQVIALQVSYDPGWEAYANGKAQPIRRDGIGLMVIAPDCAGPCEVSLRYTGGRERIVTRGLSVAAMLIALGFAWRGKSR